MISNSHYKFLPTNSPSLKQTHSLNPMASTTINVEEKSMSNRPSKTLFIAQIALRGLTALLALASTIVMLKSSQTTTIFGIDFQANYNYATAFRVFVGANLVVLGLSVSSLIAVWYHGPNSNGNNYFSLFLHDLITTILLMGGCAGASAIGYVGRYGQDQIGWTKICDDVTKFCNFVMVSITLSYLAFICLFALTIMAFWQARHISTD